MLHSQEFQRKGPVVFYPYVKHRAGNLLCKINRWRKIERWDVCFLTTFLKGHHEERSHNYSNRAGVLLPLRKLYRPVVYC